jgi:hypothetical protein
MENDALNGIRRLMAAGIACLLAASAAYAEAKPTPKDIPALPLEKIAACLNGRLQLTTLQQVRAEKELVGKTFQGVITVGDVKEVGNQVMIEGWMDGRAGPGRADIYLIDEPKLKAQAAELKRGDKFRVTAKFFSFNGSVEGGIIAAFGHVTFLALKTGAPENVRDESAATVTDAFVAKLFPNSKYAIASSGKFACVMGEDDICFLMPFHENKAWLQNRRNTPMASLGDWMLTHGFAYNSIPFKDVKPAGIDQDKHEIFDLYNSGGEKIQQISVYLDHDGIIKLQWLME